MKNTFLSAFAIFILFTANAQITQEAVYPNGASYSGQLHLIQLTGAGYKYCMFDKAINQIGIYNLNHSVYQLINVPNVPPNAVVLGPWYVSDALFDQNTSDIEYVFEYYVPPSGIVNFFVFRDNGLILFHRDSVDVEPMYWRENPNMIFNTPAGAKMVLSNQGTFSATVYALPGSLPCNDCNSTMPLMIESPSNGSSNNSAPYPNPAVDYTTIPYTLPTGERTGWLVVFDVAGKEVQRLQITDAFSSVTLNTHDIAAGTYTYRIEAGKTVVPGEKLVIVH